MRSRLTAIGAPEIEEAADDPLASPATAPAAPSRLNQAIEKAAMAMLFAAVKALSQRALVAIGNLYALLLAASAFWLWWIVLPAPSVRQLVGLALYGGFVLAMLMVRRP